MDEITLPISTHIHNSQNPKYKNIYVVKLVSWKCAYFKGEKNAQNIKNTFNTYKPDEKGMIVSDKAFESLDSKTQTILASIAWQYGVNRNKKTGEWILKEFWDIRDNKSKISKKLKGMAKLEYTNRRNTEANYIKST